MIFTKEQKAVIEAKEDKIVVLAAAASGKALENETPLYGEYGKFPIRLAKIGDKIYCDDGKLHTITGVYPQGEKECYEVTFSDNTKAICCNEHLWTFQTESLRSKKSKTWITCSLQEIIDKYPLYKSARAKNNFGSKASKRKNIFIPMIHPVNFPEADLPLPPYTLGALLGDGTLGDTGIESRFSNEDEDIINRVNNDLNQIGYHLLYYKNYDYRIVQNNTNYGYLGKLNQILQELGLNSKTSATKFIPSLYKYSSVKQRLELLQGIIDTDGYCDGSSYDLVLKSLSLIEDVKEICESLGLTATFSIKKAICTNSPDGVKDCGQVYRLRIKTSALFPRLHSSQKREKQWKPAKVYSYRAITDIKPLNIKRPMTCITVDSPNHLFAINNFIITHNTQILTERIKFLLDKKVTTPERIVMITFTNAAAEVMRQRLGEYGKNMYLGTIHGYCNYLLRNHGIDTSHFLNEERFDELFEEMQKYPEAILPVDYLLLDEAQDSTSLEFQFLLEMIDPLQFMLVGDLRQCQPAGTKVLLRGGIEKNIEDIKIGDDLVWYDNSKGYCSSLNATAYNTIHKRVTNIASRSFVDDELITIEEQNGRKSTYTPNHRTFVNFHNRGEYKHLVYLMSKNDRFRVGKILTKGKNENNSWRAKMTAEGADKMWILKVFKTDLEARREEQRISYKYQIPQTCWQTDKVTFSNEDIDYIYEGLDTYKSAKKCLKDYHRDINYPLIDKNIDWSMNQKYTSNATAQIFACNLIPEVMDCVIYDNNCNNRRKKFSPIINISYNFIKNPILVYSLEVEGSTYIADGIITHNCIYEWRGSSPQILYNISKRPDVKVYDLLNNFRNGSAILTYAKQFVDRLGPRYEDRSVSQTGIAGSVKEMGEINLKTISRLIKETPEYGKWFVLVRTNTQIDMIMNYLKGSYIPCTTFKRAEMTLEELSSCLNENSVKILTVHSAKGLENDYVIVYGCNPYGGEESRICYVAATRARKRLYWIKTNKPKKNRNDGLTMWG